MSTVAELIVEFRETVRQTDADNSHFSDTEIMRWVSFAQNILTVNIDIIFKEQEWSSVAEQRGYALPSDFKAVVAVQYDGTICVTSVLA